MSSANKESLIFPFPICIALISCLIAIDRTPKVERSGEIGHPCFVPNLSGKLSSFSSLSMMLTVGTLDDDEEVFSISSLLRDINHEWR